MGAVVIRFHNKKTTWFQKDKVVTKSIIFQQNILEIHSQKAAHIRL